VGRRFHHYHTVTAAQRAATRPQATASRHGPSVVYVDGAPVVLQAVAKQLGVPLETISRRVRDARAAGRPITMDLLLRPISGASGRKGR